MSFVLWISGVPGVGKTTLGKRLSAELNLVHLDGNIIRQVLYPNLGFSKEDRLKHNDVMIGLAKRLKENSLSVVVSAILPYNSLRNRALLEIGEFVQCHLKCPIEDILARGDPHKAILYQNAIEGNKKNLTGYNDENYEEPKTSEITIWTNERPVEEEVEIVKNYLRGYAFI